MMKQSMPKPMASSYPSSSSHAGGTSSNSASRRSSNSIVSSVAVSSHSSSSSSPLLISPGIGLGPFKLGASIGSILAYVQQHAMTLRDNELICSPNQPTSNPILLALNDIGVRLRFDAYQQRLTLIEVVDHTLTPLVYMKTLLRASHSPPATLAHLYYVFGPTYAGSYDEDSHMYLLQYPGICMTFALPSNPVSGDDEREQEIVTLPDGSSPPLARLFIHAGSSVHDHAASLPPLPSSSLYFEPIVVQLTRGIFFTSRNVFLGFDSFVQDVISVLGAPQNIYTKQSERDRMSIHKQSTSATTSQQTSQHTSPSIQPRRLHSPQLGARNANGRGACNDYCTSTPNTPDYFHNYFLLGLDFLFDGVTHRVKKIILHTNFIDRPDFNQYAKCNFSIPHPSATTNGSDAKSVSTNNVSHHHLSLLELPPTAVHTHETGRSMLHPSSSTSSSINDSVSPAPPSNATSPSSTTDDGVTTIVVPTGSGGGKKKKKNKETATNSSSTASNVSSDASASPAPPRPIAPAPSSAPIQSFSPSLSPSVLPLSHATSITPDSKWSDVLAVLGVCPSRPMVSSSHASSSAASILSSVTSSVPLDNPFASTYFYAYEGAVFEVCKNHQLASVTLFREEE